MDLNFTPIIPLADPFSQRRVPAPEQIPTPAPEPVPESISYESLEDEFSESVQNAIDELNRELDSYFDDSRQQTEPVVEREMEESRSESEGGGESEENEEALETAVSDQTIEQDTPVEYNEFSTRFSGASWFDTVHSLEISICGLGGIGSNAAYAVSRLYPRTLLLYDFDRVDAVNMAGQMYSYKETNQLKTFALIKRLEALSPELRIFSYGRVDSDSYLAPVTVCGFDNMQARRTAYERWKTLNGRLFIDARMNMEYFQIFCIESTNQEAMRDYEENWLFSSSEAEATTCSQKQTTFTGMILGGMIANLIVNYANNLDFLAGKEGVIDRPLPYKTVYSADFMTLELD